ncbi:MAG: hypothetical protein JWP74_2288, partial [Marmoricola sp.]|nr:hypothetical protein [Marmoricola sp.]
MRSVVRPVRARRVLAIGVVATALSVLTACGGSALSPSAVRDANDKVAGGLNSTGGSTTPGSTTPGSTTPGSTTPGSTTPGSTTPGSTTPGSTTPGSTTPGSTTPGKSASLPGVKAGSCAGFKNGPGMTNTTINIGNSSDLSGPVPGLFTAAQQATQAYVQYFNSTSSICGRKLVLNDMDSRTDAGADQASYQKMCDSDFASVGSMSAFDSGGAATAQGCGLPDIRSAAVTATRNACSTCFGAQATGPHEFSNEVPDY